jgi:hypothetical protein
MSHNSDHEASNNRDLRKFPLYGFNPAKHAHCFISVSRVPQADDFPEQPRVTWTSVNNRTHRTPAIVT